MAVSFLILLDQIREDAGIPFHVNSGYRTVAQNKKDGGKRNSAHRKGQAADIKALTSKARYKIIAAAIKNKISRIGIGKTFIHLDNSTSLPTEVVWLY